MSFPVQKIKFTENKYFYSITSTRLKFINPNSYLWVIAGSLGIASAILFAAYRAHGLEDAFKETPRKERAWSNAVDYLMFHGLALLVIGFYGGSGKSLDGPFSLIKVTPF